MRAVHIVRVDLNARSIRRVYELPVQATDVEREAFVGWLLDLLPPPGIGAPVTISMVEYPD